MMEYGMWLIRLILVFGLIGQLLWAQGSLAPRPSCPHRARAMQANVRPVGEEGKGCCRSAPREAERRASCAGRGTRHEYAPSPPSSAGCKVTNCCRHRAPRPPRPVDRIAPPQKRPDAALCEAVQSFSTTTMPPASPRPRMRTVPITSQRHRLASLCVWRN
jgi:hypothetical protein